MRPIPSRPRSTLLTVLLLWFCFYASVTLFTPALFDDADSVHAEVAREMLLRHDYVTLHANGIRYLEKAPLFYWSMAACMRASQRLGATTPRALAAAARLPLAFTVLALALLCETFARRLFQSAHAGLYAALIILSSFGIFIFTRILIPDAMVCLWLTLALYAFWRSNETPSWRSHQTLSEPSTSTTSAHPQNLSSRPKVSAAHRSGETPVFLRRMHELEELSPPPPHLSSRPEVSAAHRSGETPALLCRMPELEDLSPPPPHLSSRPEREARSGETPALLRRIYTRRWSFLFATACALNVLTKGLIGLVFPLAIVTIYLLLTEGFTQTRQRLRTLHPLSATILFLIIAAPWHILAGLHNPTQGHPAAFHFVNGHWQIPLPTDGNVRGWFWFYFMNEHLLRYLNLRVPHDYDTSPLWLFWGLCLVWIMPWSAFAFQITWTLFRNTLQMIWLRIRPSRMRTDLHVHGPMVGGFLLFICVAFVLLFFSLSTRQEYYVLPALPALAILIAGWLAHTSSARHPERSLAASPRDAVEGPVHRSWLHDSASVSTTILVALGTLYAVASVWLLLHTQAPAPNTDLAILLTQNPGDYALSMGHFLDLNARALGLFRLPLALSTLGLFAGPLAALLLSKRTHPHAANLALAAGTFCFLLAAFLALRTFTPVLSSAQLADAIRPQVHPDDLIVIHGEYEAGSTLGFYLQRDDIHILDGRSSNLWYGSFFPDAPKIFETPQSFAKKWASPQRIFLWQSTSDEPRTLPLVSGPVYVIAASGGKEVVSNQRSE